MDDKIGRLKGTIVPVLKKNNVRRAAIFGSVARGEDKAKSDVDILVEFKGKATLLTLGRLYWQLEEKLDRKVDIVTYGSIDPRFRDNILSSKVDIL